jgi:transketolase
MGKLQTINLLSEKKDAAGALFKDIRRQLSLNIVEICKTAGSGHLGGSLSSVELLTSLYFGGHLKFCLDDPRHPYRDRVLVRGHLGPLRYPLFSLLGWVKEEELTTYRRLGSRLQGHESMLDLPGVDITPSGSLGMLLSYGVGAAVVSKNKKHQFKTYVFLGDGEEQEGNVSEAARHAANLGLDNLVCILDQNGKQLSRPTSELNKASDVATIWKGYGWNVIEVENGHNPLEISAAYEKAGTQNGPTLIIAKTVKGIGLTGAEDNFCGYHAINACAPETVDEFIFKLREEIKDSGNTRDKIVQEIKSNTKTFSLSESELDSSPIQKGYMAVDVTEARNNLNFDDALVLCYKNLVAKAKKEEGSAPDLYFLTADLIPKNLIHSCGLNDFKNFYDVSLREQHMFAMAHGISVTDPNARVHIHCGDAFAFRSMDQLHSAGQGQSRIVIVADRAGLSNGRNGSTHESSSQPFSVNAMPNTVFLEPSDVEDYYACLNYSFDRNDAIYYVRSHSLSPAILPKLDFDQNSLTPYYEVGEPVENPDITLVGSGITTFYLWKALDEIKASGIKAKLINITAPSKLGTDFAKAIANDRPCLCVYNGHPDFLPSVISPLILANSEGRPSVVKGHGFKVGSTGTIGELEHHFGFDKESLAQEVQNICHVKGNKRKIDNGFKPT